MLSKSALWKQKTKEWFVLENLLLIVVEGIASEIGLMNQLREVREVGLVKEGKHSFDCEIER